MKTDKKWNLLFISDEKSIFDLETKKFRELFESVDIVNDKESALTAFMANKYDIVLSDLSVEPEKVTLLKQMKDLDSNKALFALVSEKDSDKLFSIADLGINAFELIPEQFEQALEAIAEFNPYEKD